MLKKAVVVRFCCVVIASHMIVMFRFSSLILKSLISIRGVWDRFSLCSSQYGFIKFYQVGSSLPEMISLYTWSISSSRWTALLTSLFAQSNKLRIL